MTPDQIFENSCQGKIAHRTPEQAAWVQRALHVNAQYDIYQCEFCAQYHVASRRRFRKWERRLLNTT